MSIRVNPQEQYQSVSDSELLHLAEEYDHLVPEAQQALLAELQRRGLKEGVQTAKSVEADAAAAAAGPTFLTITEAGGRLSGSFQVIAPRGNLHFPELCPRCGNPANKLVPIGTTHLAGTTGFSTRIETVNYRVPYCNDCARVPKKVVVPILVGSLVFVIAVAGIGAALGGGQGLRIALGILALIMFAVLRAMRGRAPVVIPEGIFMIDYDDRSVSFVIRHRNYAERFCEMNRELLRAKAS